MVDQLTEDERAEVLDELDEWDYDEGARRDHRSLKY